MAESLLNFRGALLRSLVDRGCEVHVVAPELEAGSAERLKLESQGFHVHTVRLSRTGTNTLTDVRTLFGFWCLMRSVRPSVVLAYTIKPVIYGLLAASIAGVPRRFGLITGLGYAFTGQAKGLRGAVRHIAQSLYKQALARSCKVFFQNPDDEALFRQLKLLAPEIPSIVVNGSGVDVAAFDVKPLPHGKTRFLLIARLLGDKGVREYAEAARRIRAKYPAARFDLVGWIDVNPDAIKQEELDEWVKAGDVNFLGRLSDVRPAIAESTVYVLPSYREGTPRTVLEAMAMGRAVITTDAPGCRETVVHEDNGFLVPVKSVDALADAMERFLTTPDLARRMGLRSRRIAEEKYDVHKVNAVMLGEMGL